MAIIFENLKPNIETIIEGIHDIYKNNIGLILSEDDLKCLLFRKLSEINEISYLESTSDSNYKASYIHSEVPWFDSDEKLKIIPDITILEPQDLHLKDKHNLKLPSKRFIATLGKAIVFELKFVKTKCGISKYCFETQIKKDFLKIQRLFTKLNNQGSRGDVFCYFVIFNKSNRKCEDFNTFFNENENGEYHKIIYKTINFEY